MRGRATHHFHSHRTIDSKIKKLFERLVYIIAIAGPLTDLPQVWDILKHHDSTNVSFTTWLLFVGMELVWLGYGVIHKEKPIIISNGLWLLSDLVVIASIVIYR